MCNCRIKDGMTLKEAMSVLCGIIDDLEREIDLSGVKFTKLGIADRCKTKSKNILTDVINALIASDTTLGNLISQLQTQINNINTVLSTDTDEKVKVTSDSADAGYLVDKIISHQTGSIKYNEDDDTLEIMGFAPLGSVMYIDRARLPDFDGTGKGKENTDVYGWAISNGQNGTRNRLGKFIRCVDDTANAGQSGGSNSITVKKENISSFTLPVTGSISNALTDDREVSIKFDTSKIADGPGGSTQLLKLGTGQSGANTMKSVKFNLAHSHSFALSASHANTSAIPIDIVPAYIYEIPIQRINP